MKGTIALDIDGTITDRTHLIPDAVAHAFEEMHQAGWTFIFITGRSFFFTMRTLPKLCFPYYLGVQNGSILFEMPERKEISRSYLTMDIVHQLETLHHGDFLVYSGFEKGDTCYYIPDRFSKEMLAYLATIEHLSDAPWIRLKSFDEIDQPSFPLVKCVGSHEEMEAFYAILQSIQGIHATFIKDPLSDHLYLILITHERADKEKAVTTLMQTYSLPGPLITGGNDNNDIPLLRLGDQKIAITGAPKELLNQATVIAPPSDECGILAGLEKAIENLS